MKHPCKTAYTIEFTSSPEVNTDEQTRAFCELGGAKKWVFHPKVSECKKRKHNTKLSGLETQRQ